MTKHDDQTITLADADEMIDAALRYGHSIGSLPLSAAVLDQGGNLIAFKREDGSGILRFAVAFAKAYGALGFGLGSRQLAVRAAANPNFYNSVYAISEGRLAPTPGGVLIRDSEGEIAGAVGISGDASARDEACAIAGIEQAGYLADPGAAT